MRIPNPSLIQKTKAPLSLWSTIDRIKLTLGLSLKELLGLLEMTEKQYHYKRNLDLSPSTLQLFSFCNHLNLSFDHVMSGNIDYPTLALHYSGKLNTLPSRYRDVALSRRRTTQFILNFIEDRFGWESRVRILNHFQMNEAIFANPDEPINFYFASDLCEYLYRHKLTASTLATVGTQAFLSASTSAVKKELNDCTSVGEIYERMCTELISKYFEKNFDYRILKMNAESCTVSARPNAELIELTGEKLIGNSATAIMRKGIASAYPKILDLPAAHVTQSACVYQGDPEIRYEINFSAAKRALATH